jgi:hypothetical protein
MIHWKLRIWHDRLKAVRHYYKSPKFALIDLSFGFISLFINPYRTCRKFLQKKGSANIHAYGETPYATYQKIVTECGIGSEDIWMEMGAGRGKGCFWLTHFVGCQVIGVEWIPQFGFIASLFKKIFRVKKLQWIPSDIEQVNLNEATVIYLYGLWPELKIKPGVKVISISEPLEGYKILKRFWVRFPWGRTSAYLQEK